VCYDLGENFPGGSVSAGGRRTWSWARLVLGYDDGSKQAEVRGK
jgi:hypothetical protein